MTDFARQIKSDVERQGDFIRFLIKEVEGAAFVDIEDVVSFVKWLDDELSRLVRLLSPARAIELTHLLRRTSVRQFADALESGPCRWTSARC